MRVYDGDMYCSSRSSRARAFGPGSGVLIDGTVRLSNCHMSSTLEQVKELLDGEIRILQNAFQRLGMERLARMIWHRSPFPGPIREYLVTPCLPIEHETHFLQDLDDLPSGDARKFHACTSTVV